jgi:hypothetical protein
MPSARSSERSARTDQRALPYPPRPNRPLIQIRSLTLSIAQATVIRLPARSGTFGCISGLALEVDYETGAVVRAARSTSETPPYGDMLRMRVPGWSRESWR